MGISVAGTVAVGMAIVGVGGGARVARGRAVPAGGLRLEGGEQATGSHVVANAATRSKRTWPRASANANESARSIIGRNREFASVTRRSLWRVRFDDFHGAKHPVAVVVRADVVVETGNSEGEHEVLTRTQIF